MLVVFAVIALTVVGAALIAASVLLRRAKTQQIEQSTPPMPAPTGDSVPDPVEEQLQWIRRCGNPEVTD